MAKAVPLGTNDLGDMLQAVEPELRLYEQVSQRPFAGRVDEKRRRS